jgi:hypothetical protein
MGDQAGKRSFPPQPGSFDHLEVSVEQGTETPLPAVAEPDIQPPLQASFVAADQPGVTEKRVEPEAPGHPVEIKHQVIFLVTQSLKVIELPLSFFPDEKIPEPGVAFEKIGIFLPDGEIDLGPGNIMENGLDHRRGQDHVPQGGKANDQNFQLSSTFSEILTEKLFQYIRIFSQSYQFIFKKCHRQSILFRT